MLSFSSDISKELTHFEAMKRGVAAIGCSTHNVSSHTNQRFVVLHGHGLQPGKKHLVNLKISFFGTQPENKVDIAVGYADINGSYSGGMPLYYGDGTTAAPTHHINSGPPSINSYTNVRDLQLYPSKMVENEVDLGWFTLVEGQASIYGSIPMNMGGPASATNALALNFVWTLIENVD